MTLYYSGADDDRNDSDWSPGEDGKEQIIENHADYIEITDDGECIINLDEIERDEKRKTLVLAALRGVEDCDTYEVVTEPKIVWAGDDE